MSGIFGLFGPGVGTGDLGRVPDGAAARLAARGAGGGASVVADGALLAGAWHAWEGELAPAPHPVEDGEVVVAADASLYYRDALRERLAGAGVAPAGESAAALVAAAYRAWGEGCVERLEGDYAFALYDRRTRRVLCARDHAGARPLFYAYVGERLVVASTVGAVLAVPGVPDELDLATIAEQAAGLWGTGHETAYRAVRALPAAHRLTWTPGGAPVVERSWEPPPFAGGSTQSFDDAAAELRHLIGRAVVERRAPAGPTSVWLSGGWDSMAIYAIEQTATDERKEAGEPALPPLRAVSISYPVGDPGREDEAIFAVVSQWRAPVHWIDVDDIPLLEDAAGRAAGRDEPVAHPFEGWNAALARGSRMVGARVALNGHGGDQLFAVSNAYVADLVASGRWLAAAREWQAKHLRNSPGALWRWGVRPRLPQPIADAGHALRGGRPSTHYLERALPPWFEPGFVRAHALGARARLAERRRPGETASAFEARWYLTNPLFARVASTVAGLALAQGVELRFPLYDQRVIALAAARPWSERSLGDETKRLLRASMRGIVPEKLLAPRPRRTGVTTAYLRRRARAELPSLVTRLLERPLLAELGVVDAAALRRVGASLATGGADGHLSALLSTLHAELWLRAHHAGTSDVGAPSRSAD